MKDHLPTDVRLAQHLAKAGCLQFGSFQFSSKIKSPFKLDISGVYSAPEARRFLLDLLAETIDTVFFGVEVLAAIRSGGAELGLAVADRLGLPFTAVNKNPETPEDVFEGASVAGRRVLFFDDVRTKGGSIIRAADALHWQNARVAGALTVADHGLSESVVNFEREALRGKGIRYVSLTRVHMIVREAFELGLITVEQSAEIARWQANPDEYGRRDLFTIASSNG